ncbi:hypothetical protein V1525DRAFT_425012 [Lipomyces kononenkoae]|uniref:Uncharacterized protein n=1 Tax=Lipomyces kononenkoae TaxID=34357 RepID=A0ACC3T539_LIPKO
MRQAGFVSARSLGRLSLQLRRPFTTRSTLLSSSIDDSKFTTLGDASEAERDQFFKYTWGTWLKNDETEKLKRYTPFAIGGINEIVKKLRDQSSKESPSHVVSLASLSEGKNNRIYLAELDDGSEYVLRIPYPLDLSRDARKARIQSEVATMDFLRKKWGMLIPEVISWCPTADNPLEREYIMMEFISPNRQNKNYENLMQSWDPMGATVLQRATVLRVIVSLMEKILATKFSAFGSLYFTEDVSPDLQNKLPYEGEEDKELIDRWRIGPTVEKKFWQPGIEEANVIDRGPWYTPSDYLLATATAPITAYTNLLKNPAVASSELGSYLPTWIATYRQYAALTPALIPSDIQADSDLLSPRLHHPDLNPMNVLVDRSDKDSNEPFTSAYLLDWEGSSIKPFLFHGTPDFVHYRGYKIYKKEEIEDYDSLQPEQKAQIDYMIAATSNQFSFEFMIKHSFPTLINAYSPRAKLAREPYTVAMATDYDYHPMEITDLREALVKSKHWSAVTDNIMASPVNFTEEEVEEVAKDVEKWEQVLSKLPFYSTKGWVPQDMFERYLKEGKLAKNDSGEYSLIS